jgi:RNA polymerase sigma factor (sigma-70 family)
MPSPSTISPEQLAAIRESDPIAWQKLVDEYYSFVYKICRRKRINPEDSADICQDVFRSVFKSLPNFQKTAQNHSFRAWITTITKRRIA